MPASCTTPLPRTVKLVDRHLDAVCDRAEHAAAMVPKWATALAVIQPHAPTARSSAHHPAPTAWPQFPVAPHHPPAGYYLHTPTHAPHPAYHHVPTAWQLFPAPPQHPQQVYPPIVGAPWGLPPTMLYGMQPPTLFAGYFASTGAPFPPYAAPVPSTPNHHLPTGTWPSASLAAGARPYLPPGPQSAPPFGVPSTVPNFPVARSTAELVAIRRKAEGLKKCVRELEVLEEELVGELADGVAKEVEKDVGAKIELAVVEVEDELKKEIIKAELEQELDEVFEGK